MKPCVLTSLPLLYWTATTVEVSSENNNNNLVPVPSERLHLQTMRAICRGTRKSNIGADMDIKVTFLGHSTFHIDAGGDQIVIDPFLAPDNPVCVHRVEDVQADFIAVTHGHGDHIGHLKELAQATGAKVIANFEICNWLGDEFDTHAMHVGGEFRFSFGHLKLTAAIHGSQLPDGSGGGIAAGLLFNFRDGRRLYHAGDTALTYDMRMIGEESSIDLALLPIGDNFTMGPRDAAVAAQFVNAEKVVPIHYNTMPVIKQDPQKFADLLEPEGIACEIMQPGEVLSL